MSAEAAIRRLTEEGRDASLRVMRPPRGTFGLTHVHVTLDGYEAVGDYDPVVAYNPEILDDAILRLIRIAERRSAPTRSEPVSCRCH